MARATYEEVETPGMRATMSVMVLVYTVVEPEKEEEALPSHAVSVWDTEA